MKTHEITFVLGGNYTMPAKRVKADKVAYDQDSNMITFIEGTKAPGEIVYRVDRNAVLAVETF